MAIISDREHQRTIDILIDNTTYFKWFASKYEMRAGKMKLSKLIEKNEKQILYLKAIK